MFSFVMKQEAIPFLEAVKKLCKKDIQPKDLEDLNREREDAGDDPASVDRPPQAILDRIVQAWQQELATSTAGAVNALAQTYDARIAQALAAHGVEERAWKDDQPLGDFHHKGLDRA